jgi:hypothetical protein
MTSLGVDIANPSAMKAVFVSQVNLRDLNGILGTIGGVTLQVTMTDRGEGAQSPGDMIAFSVWNGNTLLYSSNWTGTNTAEMLLGGGNLKVHSGFSTPDQIPVITGPITAIVGSTSIYSTNPGMTNYIWLVSPDGAITVITDNSISVIWSTTGTKTVSVRYTNVSGNPSTTTVYNVNVTVSPVAVLNQPVLMRQSEFGVTAYPNPFIDRVYFDLQLKTDSKVRLELFDLNGTKLSTLFDDLVVAYDSYRLEYTPKISGTGSLMYRLIIDGQVAFTGKLIHQ